MGTTTNYAIPYPEPTDFVTDGAQAMENIAEKVDGILSSGAAARNLLYNGAMQIAQRTTSAVTGITGSDYYTVDRWALLISSLGTWTQTPDTDVPAGQGFRRSLKMSCTTADASPAAGDYAIIEQRLEGLDLQAIRKGTASAQPVTLSFWVKSFQGGTYVCQLNDNDNTRSVSATYTINASGTWEYKTITFPADTTGQFDNDNAYSLAVRWWLGAGSTFTSGTLNQTWQSTVSGNIAVGQTNVASSTSNYWQITGAQLTIGSTTVPFQFKSFQQDLRECQRYFMKWDTGAPTVSSGRIGQGVFISTTAGNFLLYYTTPPRIVLGTLVVSGSLVMSDTAAAFTIFVLSRFDVTCSWTAFSVQGTTSGATAYRPAFLEATGTAAWCASNMEL